MARRIYEAKITPAAGDDPIVVSVPADDPEQATQLIEAQFGPVKHWWSQPIPKANGARDYEEALDLIEAGCQGLLKALTPLVRQFVLEDCQGVKI